MPKIQQLSPHIANLIAAGEVVERPASVAKELLENAVDAGATQITIEIRDGGMTFLRVTDNGCGMDAEDAKTAFLRHATSKLRTADDLAAIGTMGFRGEALAAISSVSRIDLMTRTADNISGASLHLEAGSITEETDAGCPVGTTIVIRDLFFNTPARMKFMKSDTVEGTKVASAVQQQALAHPEVAFRFLRDGKEVLSTPGNGSLKDAAYSVYGSAIAEMIFVESRWENYTLSGYASKPTDARPSRALQTFFVNGRPIRSRLLVAALEEAYRNQIMVGKFPACVLHLQLPANLLDVNVHPAKTEVKFLNEKAVFDCVHYGVLGALNKASDKPQLQFKNAPSPQGMPSKTTAPFHSADKKPFFRTMSTQEYQAFSQAVQNAPMPSKLAAAATAAAVERSAQLPVQEASILPEVGQRTCIPSLPNASSPSPLPPRPVPPVEANNCPEPEQQVLPMPEIPSWRLVGQLYDSYIIVEEGENAYLIDKHAAHERILFEKLKANQEAISAQALLSPLACRLSSDDIATLSENKEVLQELGFEIDLFGENTVLVRHVPMDVAAEDAPALLETLAETLQNNQRQSKDTVRDEVLHCVACKAAIKAGWHSSEEELLSIANQVMTRQDLKYCPHGRPICITLSKKQLDKQFKRS